MRLVLVPAIVIALMPSRSPAQTHPAQNASSPLLIRLMERTMSGRGVIAVSAGEPDGEDTQPEKAFRKGDKLLTRLQAVADAASSDRLTVIPFRVGDAWVLAPETREMPNPNPKRARQPSRAFEEVLIGQALTSLSEKDVLQLGGAQGMALSDMPATAQERLRDAFQPPLDIVERSSADAEKKAGKPFIGKTIATLTEPIDWNLARIHAELVTTAIGDSLPNDEFAMLWGRARPERREFRLPSSGEAASTRPPRDPYWVAGPNKLKPSDLDSGTFTKPIGLAGVQPLSQVLERLSALTGLRLNSMTYRLSTVFLGSATIRCCDVLDGLRLALTAAWRRMGDNYILAWDRDGLAAVQQRLREAAGPRDLTAATTAVELMDSKGWLPILRSLPFAEDDPLALTDDQRRRLLEAPSKPGDPSPTIPFAEMTSRQQAYVLDHTASVQIKGTAGSRPYSSEDVKGTNLSGSVGVELSVQLPDGGWVYAPNEDWGYGIIHGDIPSFLRRQIAPARTLPEMWSHAKPWVMKAPIRGLMVPVLGPGRVTELAAEMGRHDFNTLFYPVLYGGYATFPTDVFPLHPALREANGWAAAVGAMRAKGITVVGYLETLAWQTEGDRAHWLNSHPEWLDRDVLGRPRLAWLEKNPEGRGPWGAVNANYVSPLASGVEGRLNRFLGEFARRPDAAAVAFASFQTPCESSLRSLTAPPLGYTMAERLECLHVTGSDPVDLWLDSIHITVPDNLLWIVHKDFTAFRAPVETPDPRAALVTRLLNKARALKPGWKTWLLDDVIVQREPRPVPESEKPKADVFLSASSWDRRPDQGDLIAVAPKETRAPKDLPLGAIDTSGITPIVLATFDGSAASTESRVAIVYDFRAVPNDITDALQWILPQEKLPANERPK